MMIEGLCCDCAKSGENSTCGDYSENAKCKFKKEDGSCWVARSNPMPDTKELRELEKAATPGPWEVEQQRDGEEWWFDDGHFLIKTGPEPCDWNVAMHEENEADARFIAAARNAMPGLLDEVERERWTMVKDGLPDIGVHVEYVTRLGTVKFGATRNRGWEYFDPYTYDPVKREADEVICWRIPQPPEGV